MISHMAELRCWLDEPERCSFWEHFAGGGKRLLDESDLFRGEPALSGSLLMLASIQDPGPVGEGDINSFLPQRGAELDRQLVQHRHDRLVGQMAEIGMNRFAGETRHRV